MTSLQLKHFKRYKDIAWLLMKYGRSDLLKEIGSEIELPERDKNSTQATHPPEELAKDLQSMGPTFIKLGQLLSTQADLLPEAYLEALVKLQDQADPFPYEEVEKTFQSELGVKIHDVFKEFDSKPLAAASLSQVHKATLPSGRVVAVKIQRPGIQPNVLEDLEVLDEIANFLEARTSWAKRYGLVDKVGQLKTSLINELDFKKEAGNLIAFKNNLQEFEDILVPSPILDYTTTKILTMDYIEGRKITHLDPLIKMDLNGEKLAGDLFKAYLKQILIDGLVHVDPHPGNVYLSEDNKIVILDLGMVVRIPPQMQNALLKLLLAVSEGQGEEAADVIVRIGQKTEDFNYHKFRNSISNIIAQYQNLNIAQMAMGKMILKIAGIGGETGLIMPAQFNMLGKALLNLDKVGKTLAPNFIPNDSIRENASELLNQRMQRNFSAGVFYRTFIEATEFLQHLPTKLNSVLDILSKNELKLQVDAFDERRLMQGCEKIANRITLGLILAALIIGAALMMKVETTFTIFGYPGIAMIFFLVAACGGIFLMFDILIYDQRKNH